MPRSFRHLDLKERVFLETQLSHVEETGKDRRNRVEASPDDHKLFAVGALHLCEFVPAHPALVGEPEAEHRCASPGLPRRSEHQTGERDFKPAETLRL